MIEIFQRFFIMVGGLVLSLIDFFKNVSLKHEPDEKLDTKMFSRWEIDTTVQRNPDDGDIIDKIRENLLPYFTNKLIILPVLILVVACGIFLGVEVSAIVLVLMSMLYVFLFYYPQIKEQNSYSDLNRELPYALRHMGIELKSGKGLHDCLITVRNADYGSLSREFNRVLEEIKFGKTTEDSLLEMSHRVNSEGLSRTVQQIVGTLRVGGNIAHSLDIIAQDISFEMQIKLKEYSQKLNSFILIYTFIAILAPVIILVMLMASSTVMGDLLSAGTLFIIYALFFPMIVVFMGVFIKKLEPKI